MSVMIDEDRAGAPRLGLASGFAGGPPGGGSGDSAESWRRLWFTLGALIVYRIGSYLPIPGVDLLAMANFLRTSSPGILGLLDLFAGMGVIGNLSIFALGILPYISAAVIVALAIRIAPPLNSLAAHGPTGRRQLNQYARILTIVLAALQASGPPWRSRATPDWSWRQAFCSRPRPFSRCRPGRSL